MNFLRNLLAAILGCLIAFGICFIMFFIFVAALGAGGEDTVSVKSNSVLEIQLKLPISDYVGADEADPFSGFFDKAQGLDGILHAIQIAKTDDDIKGISLNNNMLLAGLAQTQALRDALQDFKESGKFIYAYSDFYMQKDYYLASVADEIFLNPVGILDFKGLSSEVLFYKDLQEKTGVKMEVIRHGKYKSAVEPFISDTMSDANRQQISELIGSLWTAMVAQISESRNITPEQLNTIADELGGRLPELAKSNGLIDDLLFYDQYEAKLKSAVDIADTDKLNTIDISDYMTRSNLKKTYKGDDKIAVIFAQGEIIYGEGDAQSIGQGIMKEAINKAADDDKIKAIVLRIDSPGGSALSSDIIWREIELAKEKKPVVVSMGNVAASGGYYIAAGADKIFAEPTTITGSIGVFGMVPNASVLAENIGINAEQVGTNKNSVDYSLFEPMTETFRGTIQQGIENTYEIFLKRVSDGRNITMAQADSIAQGRVWSGTEALNIGLVDALGNMDDAIAAAAELAETTKFSITKFPKYKSGFERLMEDLGGASTKAQQEFIKEEIGAEAYGIFKEVKHVMKQKGVQARMPFVLEIK